MHSKVQILQCGATHTAGSPKVDHLPRHIRLVLLSSSWVLFYTLLIHVQSKNSLQLQTSTPFSPTTALLLCRGLILTDFCLSPSPDIFIMPQIVAPWRASALVLQLLLNIFKTAPYSSCHPPKTCSEPHALPLLYTARCKTDSVTPGMLQIRATPRDSSRAL